MSLPEKGLSQSIYKYEPYWGIIGMDISDGMNTNVSLQAGLEKHTLNKIRYQVFCE